MLQRVEANRLGVIALSTLAMLFLSGGVRAQDCYHCQRTHCPPPYKHCQEGAPRLKFQCGCPLPVCNPCTAPNWGYFQTCWNPWPWPQDWSHCPVTPPAAFVTLNPPALNHYSIPATPSVTTPIQRFPGKGGGDDLSMPRPLTRPGLD